MTVDYSPEARIALERLAGLTLIDRVMPLVWEHAINIGIRTDVDPCAIALGFVSEWWTTSTGKAMGLVMRAEAQNRAIIERHQREWEALHPELVKQRPPARDGRAGGPAGTRRAHSKRRRKAGRR